MALPDCVDSVWLHWAWIFLIEVGFKVHRDLHQGIVVAVALAAQFTKPKGEITLQPQIKPVFTGLKRTK